MTATMSSASRSHKHLFKRLVSLLMAFTMLFGAVSMCAIQATAATNDWKPLVKGYKGMSKPDASTANFCYSGNRWSEKKLTITRNNMGKNINTAMEQDARFIIRIYDKNGTYVRAYPDLRINDSFRLPKGNQRYTINVVCYFNSNYDPYNYYHAEAARSGRYTLK